MTLTHSHIGHAVHVGYMRVYFSRHDRRPGRLHALNATARPDLFVSLCGVRVWLVARDMYGDPVAPNVMAADDQAALRPTCKRCRKVIAAASRAGTPAETPAM